jgi:SET domain-containing protein
MGNNIAERPTAKFGIEAKSITFYALEDIDKHKEICINYGGNPELDFSEWFTARNITYHDV